jgi:cobalt/nickel transport system ATP-binding protein
MNIPILMEFDQIDYVYPCGGQPAIKNLTLEIPKNQCCALIGRNGCGKTTLFRLANGLYRPQKGVIRWQGKPLNYDRTSLNQLRQEVGLVFQDPEQQLVAATVQEDISYGLCNLGLPNGEIAQLVGQTLVDFELTDLAHHPVNYLSLGQKKRVSIADIMVLQPKLLLLDEPTAYLDPQQTRNLMETLEKIRRTGATIVIASHDLDFIYNWADRIFVLDRGQLVLEGTPATVFRDSQFLQDLGLGIPIALDIVQSHMGTLTTTANPQSQLQIIERHLRARLR